MTPPPARYTHWHRTLALTVALLVLGFMVSFVVAWFARDLSFDFLGWPFSYWVASQGALLVFLFIVWAYARAMDRLDGTQQPSEREVDPH